MNPFVSVLTSTINKRIEQTIRANNGSRLMFHGPNIDILELVFNELLRSESVKKLSAGQNDSIPILLLTARQEIEKNPAIGKSGRCDETHLLHLRNHPTYFRFVALVPPGLHKTRSIESTADEFGMAAKNNASHSSFDNWWSDEFVQHLITEAITHAGLLEQEAEARKIVEHAARALDEISKNTATKDALWRLISRIFSVSSVSGQNLSLSREEAWSLACGMPKPNGVLSYKKLSAVLQQIADVFCDGLNTGRDRILQQLDGDSTSTAKLEGFVAHLKGKGASFTEIEGAISALYLPHDGLTLVVPPAWWNELSVDDWLELLAEEPEEVGALRLECTNGISLPTKGCPIIVKDEAILTIFAGDAEQNAGVTVSLAGMPGKEVQEFFVVGSTSTTISKPSPRKTPINYKVSAEGFNGSSVKVLSLTSWLPGLFATCRVAKRVSIPKSPRKGKGNASWESELRVPGSGRYEIEVYLSPDSEILGPAVSIQDDSTEKREDQREIIGKLLSSGKVLFEIEVEGKSQLDIPVHRTPVNGPSFNESFRVYIVSEDVKEEGCRSEFERLINANRSHIEKTDTKQVVQLNRNARSSSLQSWILDKENIERSFLPLIMAEDYAKVWGTLRWGEVKGSILSEGIFLHDPRPAPELFSPPNDFIAARRDIAEKIRSTTDEQSGLVESAQLGTWLNNSPEYAELIERYLDSYQKWFTASPEIACWVDVIAAVPLGRDGRTLQRTPDAILLSPLHPLRLAWHSVAQGLLVAALEKGQPCPAASVIAPGQIPDILTLPIQAPEKTIDTTFIAIESSSDYWSILWNGQRLSQISSKAGKPPFDDLFGLTIGSISGGFSATQVQRSLDDVSGILSAKPIINLTLASAGGVTDSCNEGLVSWCTKRLGSKELETTAQSMGSRMIQLFDTRSDGVHLDDAIIANLSEDTNNRVRWFKRQPKGITPDLGIIAQLDSSEPEIQETSLTSPMGIGGLLRHRIRAQLPNAFLIESRQSSPIAPSGLVLEDKLTECLVTIENKSFEKFGYQYAPNVIAVEDMFIQNQANFVAISSASFDPACFSGGWLSNSYLWDYELPSYSPRAGDTNGYYLLSRINDVDKDGLAKVLKSFPECSHLDESILEEILFEVSRRGIPTVKGLSGAHTTATGDLGLFIAVRLLQDQFRIAMLKDSLLPVIKSSEDEVNISLIVPVDPFKGYLADLSRSLARDYKDVNLSRPDLIIAGITIRSSSVFLKITPIEVKFRQNNKLSGSEAKEALGQARAFSTLLNEIKKRSGSSLSIWKIAFQHLLLSMVGFGFRVYSNHQGFQNKSTSWSEYYKSVAEMILTHEENVSIDEVGRLIVIDDSRESVHDDNDSDGFNETITLSKEHAGKIIAGAPELFYDRVRKEVGDWNVYPQSKAAEIYSVLTAIQNPTLAEPTLVAEQSAEHQEEAVISPSPLIVEKQKDDEVTPQNIEGGGVVLKVGHTANAFESRPVTLNVSDTQLNQLNIGVVGDLGTGKTQLLKSLIYQVAASEKENRSIKPKFLIFDYKRDYSSDDFVSMTNAKVVKPFQLPLNLFDTSDIGETNIPWLDRFRFFADVLDKIYSGIGPVQRDKLKNATRAAYELANGQGKSPTIYDIHSCYRDILNGKSDSPMAIIDDLVDMEVFTRDESKIIPFSEFLDGVVVISLDSMGQDDRSKNMVVAILLNMFYENMLKTPKRGFVGKAPQLRAIDSYLLVDEADNIMRYEFDVLRKLLLQGREFGTGVILASQYLRHFKSNATDYKEPLLTWFIHKVPNITAQELATLGLAARLDEVVQSVKELPNHHCLYKTHDTGGEFITGLPFYKLISFD